MGSSNATKGYFMKIRSIVMFCLFLAFLSAGSLQAAKPGKGLTFDHYAWTEVKPTTLFDPTTWQARAGTEVVVLGDAFYLLGGRSPNAWVAPPDGPIPGDSTLWGDVWRSIDRGANWERVLETDNSAHWPARAYHEVVSKGGRMFLLGGQDYSLFPNPACQFDPENCFPKFLSTSQFFNDVWSSADGINWTLMTAEAPWAGRAGLSAIVFRGRIYVMGGSFNDDSSIIDGQPERKLFNDVWSSADGVEWVQHTAAAPWAPRAGAALVVKDGYLWLLGGEFAFFAFPPPYFNDVWRTRDGMSWELVTESAGWSPRPGHTCEVLKNTIVCFGGFGLNEGAFEPGCPNPEDPSCDPFKPSNPMDAWVSRNGADWTMLPGPPWNADGPEDIKYDYDTVVAPAGKDGRGRAIYTFGGDRETFNFFDPTQWLNVDNDVWKFYLPKKNGK